MFIHFLRFYFYVNMRERGGALIAYINEYMMMINDDKFIYVRQETKFFIYSNRIQNKP